MAQDSAGPTGPIAGPSSQPDDPTHSSAQEVGGIPSPEALASDPNAIDAQIPSPPPFYHSASQAATASIASIRSSLHRFPTPILKIQRVNQLDAELLDRELAELLLDPVKKALGSIRSTLPSDLEPELLLLLKLALFKFSIVDRGASYGSMLQNLKYRNEWAHRGALQSTARDQPLSKLQLTLYPLLTIVAPYLGSKWQDHMTSLSYSDMPNNDPRRLLWKLTDASQRVWSALVLANFAVFLADGKFRSVADRVLGMRLTYAQRTMNRNVSFEFLNRQLVWHAFTEFLLFLLPLVRPKRLFRRLMKLPTHPKLLAVVWKFLPLAISRRLGMRQDAAGRTRFNRSNVSIPVVKQMVGSKSSSKNSEKAAAQEEEQDKGPYHHLPSEVCAICYQRLESQTGLKRDPTKLGTGGLSMGIPTSDPLDPSSGLLAPDRPSSSSQPLNANTGSTAADPARNAVLGVSPDGIAYADAIVTTPYETMPCQHRYCYVCIAKQLLDEEMEDELDEEDEAGGRGWKCLRCNTRVRETRRADVATAEVQEEEDDESDGYDEDEEEGH
ncbi:related to peroxisome assembly protein car1 [Ustilago trichophora]|uniref:RING-type E3 ubiquitin transferase (cysteine targeting) n=1 Tax=Ustilago trichophora TaxID=86804 RepID=A0A5C3DUJ0_9BASI|nr:related to peroxisome assembly protein car1 [Ustilago trichophora]